MECLKCKREIPVGSLYCNYCGKRQTSTQRRRTRGNGSGSVFRSGKGWRVELVTGYKLVQRDDGTLHKKRLTHTRAGFAKKQDALDYIYQYKMGAAPDKAADRHNYDITLRQLYEEWLPTHPAGKSTLDCYRSGMKIFEPVLDLPMREQDIDDLQDCLDESGKGRRTQENARAALGLVYKYGIPRNCIPFDRNLAQFLRIDAKGLQRTQGINDLELEQIRRLAAAGDRDAQLVLCHCYIGFRPTAFIELLTLRYDRDKRTLVGGIKTEAGRDRTVTISPKIQAYVDRFAAEARSGFLFCQSDGSRFTIDDYRTLFYAVLGRAGISNPTDEDGRHRLTPHSCRHTFATLLKRVPGSDKDKLELMGHTSAEMLRHYQDVDAADLRRITDAI